MSLPEFHPAPFDQVEHERQKAAAAKYLPECRAKQAATAERIAAAGHIEVQPWRPAPPMPRRPKDAA